MATQIKFFARLVVAGLIFASGPINAQSAVPASAIPEYVEIPVAGLSTSPAPLVGILFKREGGASHGAVVMMHGCGGAYGQDRTLNARHRMWAEHLAVNGYAALMLDSFTSRGVRSLCTQKFSDRAIRESDRIGDAYAALAYLRARPDIDARRTGLLGWSHGGGTVLATISSPPRGGDGFDSAVAFYPGCSSRAKAAQRFRPYAPLLVLIGEADDWTPAAPCVELTNTVAARGEPMRIITYPGTYHDFDHPGLTRLRVRTEVPNGVNPGKGVTTAPNPEAREDAKARVLRFFAETLR